MKEETIGGILQSWRKKQGKLISDCANELNAPIEYLDAIENNFFIEMPNDQYAFNLVNKYFEFVGVSGEDKKKLKILIQKQLKISDKKTTKRDYNQWVLSIFRNIIFTLILVTSTVIIFDDEFYGRELLKGMNILNKDSETNVDLYHEVQKIDYKMQGLDVYTDSEKKNKPLVTKLNTIEIQAKDDVWVEVINNQNISYISRNFRMGERYFFNFKGNETLLTDNLSNILIIYNDTLINTTQSQMDGVIEIDLKSILF